MSVCSAPGALTTIRFRSERSCEREKHIEPERGWGWDGKIKMHKQERERNVREGLLWYWSLEALLNAGCGWSLPRVRGYHSWLVWLSLLLYFPFSRYLPLTSSRDEFLVATDHQSSILVSLWISMDCTDFECVSGKSMCIFDQVFKIGSAPHFLKCLLSCLTELASTTILYTKDNLIQWYPRQGSDDSGVEQQWQSWETFTAQGKAWPHYYVTSSLTWKEIESSLGESLFPTICAKGTNGRREWITAARCKLWAAVCFFLSFSFFSRKHVEMVGTRTCSEPHRREGAALGLLWLNF